MRYEWLKAALVTGGIFAAWLAFFHLTLRADAIRPLGSSSSGGVSSVRVLTTKGLLINGSANTTVTSTDLTFSLASSLTFDTITSNAAQPVTFTPATGVIRLTDAAGANITTLTPNISGVNVSVGGTGNFILAAGNTLNTDKVHATTSNATLTIEGDGATGGVQVGSSQTFAAQTGIFTNLYGTTGVINTLTCVTLATTTFTATSVVSTNVTATKLFTDSVYPKTSGSPVTVYDTAGGLQVATDDGIYVTSIRTSTGNTTISAPGAGTVTIDPSDSLVASFITLSGPLFIPAAGGIVDLGTAGFVDATAIKLVSTNTTVTNLWTNAIGRRAAGALVLSNTTGVNVAMDDGTQASTIVPSTNQLTITPPGGASGVLELGDGLAGTFIAGTIDATTAFVCTGNATVSGFFFNTTRRPFTGTSLRDQATTLSIEDMSGANASTLAATSGTLTLNVNGTGGVFQINTSDSLAAGASQPDDGQRHIAERDSGRDIDARQHQPDPEANGGCHRDLERARRPVRAHRWHAAVLVRPVRRQAHAGRGLGRRRAAAGVRRQHRSGAREPDDGQRDHSAKRHAGVHHERVRGRDVGENREHHAHVPGARYGRN
jgi:hypothetical protein